MIIRQSTIHGKYHGNTGYLLGNVDTGIQDFTGMGNCVNEGQTRGTDESQMMTSRQGRTSELHKQIAQTNRTNELHKRITQTNRTKQEDVTPKNGNNKRCFGVLQSNSGAYGVPETG